jgi:hypothetical protein
MSTVNENLVREFFEMHGFFVKQLRKHSNIGRGEDDEVDFLVLNPTAQSSTQSAPVELPFELSCQDMGKIHRAIVEIKGWHTDIFSSSLMVNAPEIFRFLDKPSLSNSFKVFGKDAALTKILVVSALPQNAEAREQSIQLLKSKGMDAVIQFRTILSYLISEVQVNRNYQKSDVLQVIRILKNYDLFKDAQMELFQTPRRRVTKEKPAKQSVSIDPVLTEEN